MHQVQVHSNLLAHHAKFNAWRPDLSFSVEDLSTTELEKLKEYSLNEHVFGGVGSSRDSDLFDQKFESFINGMKSIVFGDNHEAQRSILLFAAEHKPQLPSRIRTYKGIVPTHWKERVNVKEHELNIGDKRSLLTFVAEITEDLFFEASQFFMDDARSFIVSSSREDTCETLLSRPAVFLSMKGNVQVNYVKLLLTLSPMDRVYRIGGNKGEDYWSVQEFVGCTP